MKFDPGIRKLRAAKAFPAICDELGIARTAPYDWKRVPAKRVLAISRITGLSPHELRPDLYPKRLLDGMKAAS
jgi:hypothetical protein